MIALLRHVLFPVHMKCYVLQRPRPCFAVGIQPLSNVSPFAVGEYPAPAKLDGPKRHSLMARTFWHETITLAVEVSQGA
jgi:hypothetical protein